MRKIIIPLLVLAASCSKKSGPVILPQPTNDTVTFATSGARTYSKPVNVYLDTTGAVIGAVISVTAGPNDVAGIMAVQPGVVVYTTNQGGGFTITFMGLEFGHPAFRVTQ